MKIVTGYPVHVITVAAILWKIPLTHTAQRPECYAGNTYSGAAEIAYNCLPTDDNVVGLCLPGYQLKVNESSCIPGDVRSEKKLHSDICKLCDGDSYMPDDNLCDDCIPRTVCGPNERPSKERYYPQEDRECLQQPTSVDVHVLPTTFPTCPPCPECPTPNTYTSSKTPSTSTEHSTVLGTITTTDAPKLGVGALTNSCDEDKWYTIAIVCMVIAAVAVLIAAVAVTSLVIFCVKYRKRHDELAAADRPVHCEEGNRDNMEMQPQCKDRGNRAPSPNGDMINRCRQGSSNVGAHPGSNSINDAPDASCDSHEQALFRELAEGPRPSNIDTHLGSSSISDAQDVSDGSTHNNASLGSPSIADQGMKNDGDDTAKPKMPRRSKPSQIKKDYDVGSGTPSAQPLLENSSAINSIQSMQEPYEYHRTLSNASSSNSTNNDLPTAPYKSNPLQSCNTANKVWKAYEKAEGQCGIVTDCSEDHIDFVKDNIDIKTRKDFYAKLGISSKVVDEKEHDAGKVPVREEIRYVLLTGFLRIAENAPISKLLKALQESGNGDVAKKFKRVFKAS